MHEREPDHTQDPREVEVGDQYPEVNPAGPVPADGEEQGPESETADTRAPSTSDDRDSDPDVATENPRAAG